MGVGIQNVTVISPYEYWFELSADHTGCPKTRTVTGITASAVMIVFRLPADVRVPHASESCSNHVLGHVELEVRALLFRQS